MYNNVFYKLQGVGETIMSVLKITQKEVTPIVGRVQL